MAQSYYGSVSQFACVLVLFLCVCCCSSQPVTFLALGDWGGQQDPPYTTDIQIAVASQMGKTASSASAQFLINTGDNFYDDGVANEFDPRFTSTFEDVYSSSSLNFPWYMVLGNHDYHGNITGQIAYSQRSTRWVLPAQFYTITRSFASKAKGSSTAVNGTVQFVFIDTFVFCGPPPQNQDGPWPGPLNVTQAQQQLAWLNQTLASSTADWLIVVGHYPIWSIAENGPTPLMVSNVKPLLEKYHVAAYYCGHDHDMQLLNDGSGVDYFVVGGGHKMDTSTPHSRDVPVGSSKFVWPTKSKDHGGFVVSSISSATTMTSTFYDDKGTELYQRTTTNPRPSSSSVLKTKGKRSQMIMN